MKKLISTILIYLMVAAIAMAELQYITISASSLGLTVNEQRIEKKIDGFTFVANNVKKVQEYMNFKKGDENQTIIYNITPIPGRYTVYINKEEEDNSILTVTSGTTEQPTENIVANDIKDKKIHAITIPSGHPYFKISVNNKKATVLKVVSIEYDPNPEYSVSCEASPSDGGTISTDKAAYKPGETVAVTATPTSGYELSLLTYHDGTEHDIMETRSFIMPESDVTISGHFKRNAGDLYILGQVNGNSWRPDRGVKMNHDDAGYWADIYVTGETNNKLDDYGGYGGTFAFTTTLASTWEEANSGRYEPELPQGDDNWWVGTSGSQDSDVKLLHQDYSKSFLIPSGFYRLRVTDDMRFTLDEVKDFTPFITPNGGQARQFDEVTLGMSQDIDQLLYNNTPIVNFNGDIVNALAPSIVLYYKLNSNDFTLLNSNRVELPDAGTNTLQARAAMMKDGTVMALRTAIAEFECTSASATLADIERYGAEGQKFIVSDDLQVVYSCDDKTVAWARDLKESINSVDLPDNEITDYSRQAGAQTGEWQQNNWVMLDFDLALLEYVKHIAQASKNNVMISGGSLCATLTDATNYTLLVAADIELDCQPATSNYEFNTYIAANYHDPLIQTSARSGRTYWFMTPKVMEVARHTWSVWNGDGFYLPARTHNENGWFNQDELHGAYMINLDYNWPPLEESQLENGQAYEYIGVTMAISKTSTLKRQVQGLEADLGSKLSDTRFVAPLDLDPDDEDRIVTRIDDIQGIASSCVSQTIYYDVTGHAHDEPLPGINIVVKRLADGRTITRKVVGNQ